MSNKFENIDFDIDQIEQERRGVVELILIVFILGILLNCAASGIYDYFVRVKKEDIVFWSSLLASVVVLGFFVLYILRKEERKISIPIVIFYDLHNETISIPKEIHHPSKFRAPFIILARSYIDAYKSIVGDIKIDQLLNDKNQSLKI
ncbi:MAG: hypothetical protein RBU23_13645 [Candidatus Auribacterota bacterium]|jgi:hypothetical protein|nr:hypothetical protein [Candidatus Auribacterota bacterium]